MNARFLSVSLSMAALALAAGTDALAQGRGGAGGMGGMGGGASQGMQGGGMATQIQRGVDAAPASAPIDRSGDLRSMNRNRSSSSTQDQQQPQFQMQPQQQPQQQSRTPQELLQQNTKLSDNVAKLLPAGTDVQAAASGFKNLGEFVAAAHVSNNLGIPFADLKTKLLAGDSLGTAIQALKPDVDGQIEARKARTKADELTSG
jgi:hypothetical protein